jgi:adenylosuccinate lyase
MTAMENIALWHERDISHSSTERIMLPDASEIIHYMLLRMQSLIGGLNVYPKNMLANLNKSGDVIFSGSVLLSLVNKGLSREKGYALVQAAAFDARDNGGTFQDACLRSEGIGEWLSKDEILKDCDVREQLGNVDFIFGRVFGK